MAVMIFRRIEEKAKVSGLDPTHKTFNFDIEFGYG
jgi:hypothetical protein